MLQPWRRILSFWLCLIMLCSGLPQLRVWADDPASTLDLATITAPYTVSADIYTAESPLVITGRYESTQTINSPVITFSEDFTGHVVFDNAYMATGPSSSSALFLTSGAVVYLDMVGNENAIVTSNSALASVYVPEGSSLYLGGGGRLKVSNATGSAIGSGDDRINSGLIDIGGQGLQLEARGVSRSTIGGTKAAISIGDSSHLVVYGKGTGAAIGGKEFSLAIDGDAEVRAYASSDGAAIGSDGDGGVPTITISGRAVVYAEAEGQGAAIGGGGGSYAANGGIITIGEQAIVYAMAKGNSAAIGGGSHYSSASGGGGAITVEGQARVQAEARGDGAAIGGGGSKDNNGGGGGTIAIKGSAFVQTTSAAYGAAIGGGGSGEGDGGSGESIAIGGQAVVIAEAGSFGAAIGGGGGKNPGSSGKIAISSPGILAQANRGASVGSGGNATSTGTAYGDLKVIEYDATALANDAVTELYLTTDAILLPSAAWLSYHEESFASITQPIYWGRSADTVEGQVYNLPALGRINLKAVQPGAAQLDSLSYTVAGDTYAVANFAADTFEYDIILPVGTAAGAVIDLSYEAPYWARVEGDESVTLSEGATTATLVAYADGGSSAAYTLRFNTSNAPFLLVQNGKAYSEHDFNQALEDGGNHATIRLRKDYVLGSALLINKAVPFTFDLNGFALNVENGGIWLSTSKNTVTMRNGTIADQASSQAPLNIEASTVVLENIDIATSAAYAVLTSHELAYVTLVSGEFSAEKQAFRIEQGSIRIADASYAPPGWEAAQEVTVVDLRPAQLSNLEYSLDGGDTYKPIPGFSSMPEDPIEFEVPYETKAVSLKPSFLADGARIEDEGALSIELSADEITRTVTVVAPNGEATKEYTVRVKRGQAYFGIGNRVYGTLEGALQALQEDETITLLLNYDATETLKLDVAKAYTLDLNGKRINSHSDVDVHPLLQISAGTPRLLNGTISTDCGTAILVEGGSAPILENLSVETTGDGVPANIVRAVTASGGSTELTIHSGRYFSNSAVISAENGAQVTLISGTFSQGTSNRPCLQTENEGDFILAEGSVMTPPDAIDNAFIEVKVEAQKMFPIHISGGSAEPASAAMGTEVRLTAEEAPSGKRFKEWQITPAVNFCADSDEKSNPAAFLMPLEEVRVVAVFERVYAVTVIGGSADIESAAPGDTVEIGAGTAPEGKVFKEWSSSAEITFLNTGGKTDETAQFMMIDEDLLITAEWEDIPEIKAFYLTPNEVTLPQGHADQSFSAIIDAIGNPNTSIAWDVYREADIKKDDTIIGADGELTIAGDEEEGILIVKATLTTDSGTFFTTAKVTVTSGPPVAMLQLSLDVNNVAYGTVQGAGQYPAGAETAIFAQAKDGYIFSYWTVDIESVDIFSDTTANPVSFTMPDEAVTLTAYFAPREYSISATHGSSDPEAKAAAGTIVTLSADPALIGQTFSHWLINPASAYATGYGAADNPTRVEMPFSDLTAIASYALADYTLSVSDAVSSHSSAHYGDAVLVTATAAADHRFTAWQVSSAPEGFALPSLTANPLGFRMPAGNLSLSAQFERVYAITINGGSASVSEAAEGEEVTITLGNMPSGQRFRSWQISEPVVFSSGSLNSPVATFAMPDKELSISVLWEPIPVYTVTLDANGGSVNPSMLEVEEGHTAALPIPTRSSYRFDGWFTAADGGSQVTENTLIVGDVTLYARWTYSSQYIPPANPNPPGGSTGSASGSSTPVTTVNTVSVGDVELRVSSQNDGERLSISMTAGQRQSLISSADEAVIIDLSSYSTGSDIHEIPSTIRLNKSDVRAMAEADKAFAIVTEQGGLLIDSEALKSLVDTASKITGSSIDIALRRIDSGNLPDTLTESQREVAEALLDEGAIIVDVDVLIGGRSLGAFEGSIEVDIAYELRAGEVPEGLVVYYLSETGDLEELPCSYENGRLRFALPGHFSYYAITYSPAKAAAADAEKKAQEGPSEETEPKPQPEPETPAEPIILSIDSAVVRQGDQVLAAPPVPAQIINGRTMLPFRYLIQTLLGGEVAWDEATRTVTAEVNGVSFRMTIDDANIVIDDETIAFDQAPVIVADYTLVPLRVFEKAVAGLQWDEASRTVAITLP